MEIEASATSAAVAKKLWNIVRIAFAMMRKGVSKSKIMMELHLLLKRGKIAGKAVAESLSLHHHSFSAAAAFSCRSGEALSFVSPRDYEFSCSNSPAVNNIFHHRHRHHRHRPVAGAGEVSVAAVQRMLDMYYGEGAAAAVESPMVAVPGLFGRSPVVPVRQLRITDSPFPLKDEGLGDSLVDAKAEDFIKRFYKSLKQQKRMAYLESPYREGYA